jgi:hypothetical protein
MINYEANRPQNFCQLVYCVEENAACQYDFVPVIVMCYINEFQKAKHDVQCNA